MRKYSSRRDALRSNQFYTMMRTVQATMPKGVDYVLIGGLAVAYYANPPVTLDIDFLTTSGPSDFKFAMFMGRMNATFWDITDLKVTAKGPGYPQGALRFKRPRPDLDSSDCVDFLFTGDDEYLRSVVINAGSVSVQGIRMQVVGLEDLVVIKTLADRGKDRDDIQEIRRACRLDEGYIRKTLRILRRA